MTFESYEQLSPSEQEHYKQRLRAREHLFDPSNLHYSNGMFTPRLDLDEQDIIDDLQYDFGCPAIRQYLDDQYPQQPALPIQHQSSTQPPTKLDGRTKAGKEARLLNSPNNAAAESPQNHEYYSYIREAKQQAKRNARQPYNILYQRLNGDGLLPTLPEFDFFGKRQAFEKFKESYFIGVFSSIQQFIDQHAAFYLPDEPTRADYRRVEREIRPLYLWYKVGSGKSTRYYVFNDPSYRLIHTTHKTFGESYE